MPKANGTLPDVDNQTVICGFRDTIICQHESLDAAQGSTHAARMSSACNRFFGICREIICA
jgi:hypothetical protein